MASRTNIFLKCHKWIFCSNIIHRHRITLKLKFQFQYMMSVSRIFNLNFRKQCKSVKAKPNLGQTFKNVCFRIWGSKISNFWLPKSCMYLSNNINYIQYNFVLHYYSIFIQLHPERMDVLILSISKCAKEEQPRAFIIFSTTFVFMKERVIFFCETIYKNFLHLFEPKLL